MSLLLKSKAIIGASVLLGAALTAHASPILWLSTGGPNQLATVDVATGGTTLIGNTNVFLTDIAFDPSGNLYGIDFNSLYSVSQSTAQATLIGSLGAHSGTANALVFGADGTLYMAGSTLYKVNTGTGASTALGSGIGFQSAGDLAFVGGQLFMAASNNHLVKIDTTTGTGGDIGNIGVAGVFGLATPDNTTLYGMAGQTVFTINTLNAAAGPTVTFNPSLGFAAGSAFRTESGGPSVPEPGSVVLFGAAAIAAGVARRRNKACT